MNDVLGFLPRDAMHSAAYTMTRCPYVRLTVTFVYSISKRAKIFSDFFHLPVARHSCFLCEILWRNSEGSSNAGEVPVWKMAIVAF